MKLKVGDRIIYNFDGKFRLNYDQDFDELEPRIGKGVIKKISDDVFKGGYYINYGDGLGMWCILDELELDHQYYREKKLKELLK